MLSNSFRDWKRLIEGGKVIFKVYKYENVNVKIRKNKICIEYGFNLSFMMKTHLVMFFNQNIPLRALTFCPGYASRIQHEECKEMLRNSLEMVFYT